MTLGLAYSYRGEVEVVDYIRKKFGHPTVDVIAVRILGDVIIRFMTFSDAREAERAFASVAGKKKMGRLELSHTVRNVQFKVVVLKPFREPIWRLWNKYKPFDF